MADAEVPHPREVYDLQGQDAAEEAFEAARARGRLHHAWLLTGPEGVGKATFAYRAARRLLGAPPYPDNGILGSDPEHPVSRRVERRAHPNLMVLDRVGEDGKLRKVIPIDEVRRLIPFFGKTAADGPFFQEGAAHRVVIIDSVDDLNVSGANALLKALEEPPENAVLLLISHSPGRLLPTIRSRCRRLAFQPLGIEATTDFLNARTSVNAEDALRLAHMADGAPGRALSLAASNAIAMDDAARDLLSELPRIDESRALSIAEKFRGGEGPAQFALLFDRLAERVHAMTVDQASQGFGRLDPWAQAWETLQRLPREVEALNLDRADALFTALSELRQAARS